MIGNFHLFRGKDMVGEAVVLRNGKVMYHLYKNSHLSFESTLDYMKRKYRMVKKVIEA